MRSKTATAAFATALFAVLTAGCGAGSSGSSGGPGGAGGSSGRSAGGDPPVSATGTPVAAGNSGDGTLAVPAGADAATKKQYAAENLIAICMRSKGFAYQAWMPAVVNSPSSDEADYDTARAVRSKYGFGAYAQFVYPNDPNVPGHVDMPRDPNTAVRGALDAAQQKLWDVTLQGDAAAAKTINGKVDPNSCTGQARAKIYPDQPDEAAASSIAKADKERSSQHRQNLNGDPALVALAQSYASCLRGKGITVSSTQVTEIRNAVRFQYFSEAARRAQSVGGHLDVATATPLLTAEIQTSLADLDCGRDFRAAYLPKLKQWPDAEGVG
ncbi:MAG: hypothetical protein HOV87_32975 [Catenulispora sp.]|nr:hypothetical protein [Catenulispora sp.]